MSHNGGYKALCPACGERMRIQAGKSESLVAKPMYAQCGNVVCGATYLGELSWESVLNPPASGPLPLPLATTKRGRPPKERSDS